MNVFYNIFIRIYPFIARLISPFNAKAKKWTAGRKGIFEKLTAQVANIAQQKKIWVHCASLGEFEQGRPVIEKIKEQYPQHAIVLSFFSPSGYEIRKNYKGADIVTYLPMDSKKNAEKFLDILHPELIIFIKYEYWFYYLSEANKRNIPTILVSAIFRHNQVFFKWYGAFNRNILKCFTHLFVQNENSKSLLESIGITNVSVSGDTRFDRVTALANEPYQNAIIENFITNNKTLVAGSTWTDDDEELDHYANTHPEIIFIIAPHETDKQRIDECLKLYKNAVTYSQLQQNFSLGNHKNVLIIDTIGMLGFLYRYATVTLIGGGFGNGIHNTLEAAVYGKPVVFGEEYTKFAEAVDMVELNCAFSVENALELEKVLDNLFTNEMLYAQACTVAKNYVQSKTGATEKVMEYVKKVIADS